MGQQRPHVRRRGRARRAAVAVGIRFVDDVVQPTFWSAEGSSWTRAEAGTLSEPELGAFALHVCALREGFLALGARPTETHDQVLAWTSADGRVWRLAAHSNDAFGDTAVHLRGCTGSGGGALVVGAVGEPSRPAAWTTTDGQRFRPLRPRLASLRSGSLTAATVDPRGRAWVVGNADVGGVWTPLLYRGGAGGFERIRLDEDVFRSPHGDEELRDVLVDDERVLLSAATRPAWAFGARPSRRSTGRRRGPRPVPPRSRTPRSCHSAPLRSRHGDRQRTRTG